jgi:hypothetical protein
VPLLVRAKAEAESPTGNVFGHSYYSGTPTLKWAVNNGKKERNIMDSGPATRDLPVPLRTTRITNPFSTPLATLFDFTS